MLTILLHSLYVITGLTSSEVMGHEWKYCSKNNPLSFFNFQIKLVAWLCKYYTRDTSF